jgi:hypothetical protein
MQNEQHQSDSSEFDLAVVWRTAQYRRSADIGPWLRPLLEKTRAWVLAVIAARRDAPGQKARSSALV